MTRRIIFNAWMLKAAMLFGVIALGAGCTYTASSDAGLYENDNVSLQHHQPTFIFTFSASLRFFDSGVPHARDMQHHTDALKSTSSVLQWR